MFRKILVPLDGSPLAECTLPHAAIFASAFGAQVMLLHVVECNDSQQSEQPIDPLEWRVRKAEAQAYLNRQMERMREADVEVEGILLEGQPSQRIIEHVRETGTDLIIISSHGESGVSHWSVGSLVHKIIQRIYVSTLLVRAYQPACESIADLHYQRILAPLDGSPRAECVLTPAVRLAEFMEAELILTHVVAMPPVFQYLPAEHEYLEIAQRLREYNQQQASHYLEQLQFRLPGNISTRIVRNDDVAIGLHQMIRDEATDLVVVSAHGLSGKAQWSHGSITTNLLDYATAPILMVQDLSVNQIEPPPAERFVQNESGFHSHDNLHRTCNY